MDFKVAINNCLFSFSYGYYLNPMVKGVYPELGPRYGSFPLTVFLEDSLELLTDGKVRTLGNPVDLVPKVTHTGNLSPHLKQYNVMESSTTVICYSPSTSFNPLSL